MAKPPVKKKVDKVVDKDKMTARAKKNLAKNEAQHLHNVQELAKLYKTTVPGESPSKTLRRERRRIAAIQLGNEIESLEQKLTPSK